MTTSRLLGRRGDGSAAVRGWVACYTLGLPAQIRDRRRAEVAGDLADEALHAVRRGEASGLRRQRLIRLVLGIPADLAWRIADAPVMARQVRVATDWVPLTRWSLAILAIVAVVAAGALGIVLVPMLTGAADPSTWPGWGLAGFIVGCVASLAGVLASVPWPRRGAAVLVPGVLVGFLTAPWLWGPWLLAVVAVAVRWYQADHDAPAWPPTRTKRGAR